MPEIEAIDAHVHTYPARDIGRQAMMGTGRTDYGGTPEELLEIMERAAITSAVMVNMTPVADMRDAALAKLPGDLPPHKRREAEAEIDRMLVGRLERRNEWTCRVGAGNPRLVPLISLDPNLMSEEEMLAEMETRRRQGARGMKLHPGAQRFFPNDRRLWPVYERAAELEWPIVFHSGSFALGVARSDHARLEHFPDVLKEFPTLTVVMAHMGFGDFETCGELARDYPNAMFDCCFVINGTEREASISDDEAKSAISKVGAGRVMFGSDYPWFDPALDAARIRGLPLPPPEVRAVLYENAQRVFRIR